MEHIKLILFLLKIIILIQMENHENIMNAIKIYINKLDYFLWIKLK